MQLKNNENELAIQEAKKAINDFNLDLAIKILDEAINKNPNNSELYLLKGKAFALDEKLDTASQTFIEAINTKNTDDEKIEVFNDLIRIVQELLRFKIDYYSKNFFEHMHSTGLSRYDYAKYINVLIDTFNIMNGDVSKTFNIYPEPNEYLEIDKMIQDKMFDIVDRGIKLAYDVFDPSNMSSVGALSMKMFNCTQIVYHLHDNFVLLADDNFYYGVPEDDCPIQTKINSCKMHIEYCKKILTLADTTLKCFDKLENFDSFPDVLGEQKNILFDIKEEMVDFLQEQENHLVKICNL